MAATGASGRKGLIKEPVDDASKGNHRTRVAAQRREKMRARLIEAALIVFGQRGAEASVIDEITAVAGVSRGTYYNYFKTNEELLTVAAVEAANEIATAVMGLFDEPPDPAVRVAVGIRQWMTMARQHRHFAAFFRRAGTLVLDQAIKGRAETRRYVPIGFESGRFNLDNPELAFDLIGGAILAGINTIATVGAPKGYAEELAERVLMALGLDPAEARTIAFAPLAPIELPDDSLIERSAARIREVG